MKRPHKTSAQLAEELERGRYVLTQGEWRLLFREYRNALHHEMERRQQQETTSDR